MAVPDHILSNARKLRIQLTDAEQLLWSLLRDRRFFGVKFRRQHPHDTYILDFYCHSARLAVELDGGGHGEISQKVYDNERTKVLENEGIRILRFWNHEVLNNLDDVLAQLYTELFSSTGQPR